jgi:hypothetical protein
MEEVITHVYEGVSIGNNSPDAADTVCISRLQVGRTGSICRSCALARAVGRRGNTVFWYEPSFISYLTL